MADSLSPGPLYFWRETDSETGWLSQWYDCPFKDDEDPKKTYKTAEHYMMHHKALLFNDPKVALEILRADHPRKVKALGRKVKGFDNEVWDAHRRDIVRRGNVLKFTRAVSEEGYHRGTAPKGKGGTKRKLLPLEGSLRDMLLATGDRDIVEASPYDSIWGIGFTAANAEVARESWGLNLLGLELMEVRKMLRAQDQKEKDDGKFVEGGEPATKKKKRDEENAEYRGEKQDE
ncbi:hypothetical protein B0J13DRAFT_562564 [Dactylonectria estremocensis]|uniref:NADAR domain-containing protein n=1 Tax=Dactylonectria estremocensis TaxID=1079267 RepID=A0A9P9IUD4_9HYPO|nr:hypothetical protein B0J13DRAFT_562564 [Dactylonectria estremocensis]